VPSEYLELYAKNAEAAADLMGKQIEKDLATVKSLLEK